MTESLFNINRYGTLISISWGYLNGFLFFLMIIKGNLVILFWHLIGHTTSLFDVASLIQA
jgi:hypothetical protein